METCSECGKLIDPKTEAALSAPIYIPPTAHKECFVGRYNQMHERAQLIMQQPSTKDEFVGLWKGQPIHLMSREELIKALLEAAEWMPQHCDACGVDHDPS